jgi:hypothetical protein
MNLVTAFAVRLVHSPPNCVALSHLSLDYSNHSCPLVGDRHPDTANSYNNLGLGLGGQGSTLESLRCFLKSLEINQEALGRMLAYLSIVACDSHGPLYSEQRFH